MVVHCRLVYATTLVVRQMYHTQFQDYELIQAAAVSYPSRVEGTAYHQYERERERARESYDHVTRDS